LYLSPQFSIPHHPYNINLFERYVELLIEKYLIDTVANINFII
jgi:hypothetical protein